MDSEELLRLTSSERLSLEEEYAQQNNWLKNDDRVTFILLEKSRIDNIKANHSSATSKTNFHAREYITPAEDYAMIGDVNFFLLSVTDSFEESKSLKEGEVSIMIAEPEARRRGYAHEALTALLTYVDQNTPFKVSSIVAKVGMDNEASIRLFTQRLGFVERKRNLYFKEVELVFPMEREQTNDKNDTCAVAVRSLISKFEKTGLKWFYRLYPINQWREITFSHSY